MIAAAQRVAATVQAFWHAPMPPERLAAARFAVGLYTLWYLLPRWTMFHRIARTSPDLFEPVGLARWLSAPLPPLVLDALYIVVVAAAAATMIGVAHRYVGPLFAVSLLALLSYRNSWSMILHMHNALVVHALVIGLTPASDAWSVDRWRSPRWPKGPMAPSWRYGWPIRLIVGSTVVTYFLCGYAKLVGPQGLGWAAGQSLREQVAVNAIRYDVLTDIGSSSLFHMLYPHGWLFLLMGVGTFVLELGAPMALVHRRLGRLWALATFGLHWGIYFTMGIKFRYQMTGAAFVAFFDTEELDSLRSKSVETSKLLRR